MNILALAFFKVATGNFSRQRTACQKSANRLYNRPIWPVIWPGEGVRFQQKTCNGPTWFKQVGPLHVL